MNVVGILEEWEHYVRTCLGCKDIAKFNWIQKKSVLPMHTSQNILFTEFLKSHFLRLLLSSKFFSVSKIY